MYVCIYICIYICVSNDGDNDNDMISPVFWISCTDGTNSNPQSQLPASSTNCDLPSTAAAPR